MKAKRIIVASTNPLKTSAIVGAFERLFPGEPYSVEVASVPSGVADQPKSDRETRDGAWNRAAGARDAVPDADIWAGLEGGIQDEGPERMSAFAWIVVQAPDAMGASRTATFPLPEAIAKLVRGGTELGGAIDMLFGRENSKQNAGAIGILTDGLIDRRELYEHAAIMAMIPLKNSTLFRASE